MAGEGDSLRFATIAMRLRLPTSDRALRRLVRNVTYLFSANVLVAVLGIISLGLVARALGPAAFGVLALTESYVRLVDLVARLEPWQAVIRYGAAHLESGRAQNFMRLVKVSTLFDACGVVLSAALAIAIAWLFGHLFGWAEDVQGMAMVFALANLTHLSATPIGVLRLLDRFKFLGSIGVATAVARLAMVAVAYASGGGAWTFLAIYMACHAIEGLLPVVIAWRELARRGYGDWWRSSVSGVLAQNPGLCGFIWSSNISLTVRNSTQYLDTLLVGGMIDAAAAGLYQAAKRIGMAILKLSEPLGQAIYPDIARLWARGDVEGMRRLIFQATVAMVVAGLSALLVMYFGADVLVGLILGAGFRDAVDLVILQMMAAVVFLVSVALRPALMSMGYHRAIMIVSGSSTALFYLWLMAAVPLIGVLGATSAHLASNLLSFVATLALFLRALPRQQPQGAGFMGPAGR